MKNNKPRYVVVHFEEYNEIKEARASLLERTADMLIDDNLEAFNELAK